MGVEGLGGERVVEQLAEQGGEVRVGAGEVVERPLLDYWQVGVAAGGGVGGGGWGVVGGSVAGVGVAVGEEAVRPGHPAGDAQPAQGAGVAVVFASPGPGVGGEPGPVGVL